MKRMNEVFKGEPCGFSTRMTDEQVRHGQHAINHVDALADALHALINDACDNYDMENRKSVYNAKKALAAYRGDK